MVGHKLSDIFFFFPGSIPVLRFRCQLTDLVGHDRAEETLVKIKSGWAYATGDSIIFEQVPIDLLLTDNRYRYDDNTEVYKQLGDLFYLQNERKQNERASLNRGRPQAADTCGRVSAKYNF